MRSFSFVAVVAGLATAGPAVAQRSLFDQTPADPSAGFAPTNPAPSPALTPAPVAPAPAPRTSRPAPAVAARPEPVQQAEPDPEPAPAAAGKPRRIAKPKPKGPQPASALTFVNGSTAIVTAIAVEAETKTVTYQKPLAPESRATVKLPKLKGCTVSITTTYGSETPTLPSEVDVCKDKIVKLTD